jgi:hypothetical protein
VDSAKEITGVQKKERNDWFNDEFMEIISEKNRARNKYLNRNTRVNREDYEEKRSEARNLFKKKKKELLKKKIEEIKGPNEKKLTRKFYTGIKEINRPYQSESVVIKDEYGKPITEQKEILNRWKQYFESLLQTEIEPIEKESEREVEEVEQEMYEPTLDEVRYIIQGMKNGKAPGIDTITAELIKNAGAKLEQKIYNLI